MGYAFKISNYIFNSFLGYVTPSSGVATPIITVTEEGVATITCSSSNATIYYTIDGSTPTSSSTKYTSPVTLSSGQTIKAIAYKEEFISAVSSYLFIMGAPSDPVITLVGNTATITCDTAGATIYYSLNNSTVTSASTHYTSAVTLADEDTIYAVAIKNNVASNIKNATYTAPSYLISTSVSPTNSGTVSGGGTYKVGSSVTLTATPNTGYTFNKWSDNNSTSSTRSITVTDDAFYEAQFATIVVQSPSITISSGVATITTNEVGGTTYYTTNGDIPTSASSVYASPVTLTTGQTIKAITIKDTVSSQIVSKTYSAATSLYNDNNKLTLDVEADKCYSKGYIYNDVNDDKLYLVRATSGSEVHHGYLVNGTNDLTDDNITLGAKAFTINSTPNNNPMYLGRYQDGSTLFSSKTGNFTFTFVINVPSVPLNLNDAWSLLTLGQGVGSVGGNALFSNNRWGINIDKTGVVKLGAYSGGWKYESSTDTVSVGFNIVTVVRQSGKVSIFINDNKDTSAKNYNYSLENGLIYSIFTVGNKSTSDVPCCFDSNIYAALGYDEALSDEQVMQNHDYLKTKFNS